MRLFRSTRITFSVSSDSRVRSEAQYVTTIFNPTHCDWDYISQITRKPSIIPGFRIIVGKKKKKGTNKKIGALKFSFIPLL